MRIARIVSRLRAPGEGVSRVGQRIFPAIVFTAAGIVGLMLVRQRNRPSRMHGRPNTRAVLVVAGALIVFPLLLEPLGFVAAASVMFVAVAYAFGGRWRSAIVGPLFAAALYVAFTRGLGLVLPSGDVWSWIR